MLNKKQLLKDLKDPEAWFLFIFMAVMGIGILFVLAFMYFLGAVSYVSYGWVHLLLTALFYFGFDHHGDVKHKGLWKIFKRFSFIFALMFYIVSYFIMMTGIGDVEIGKKVIDLIQSDFPNGLMEAVVNYPFRIALLVFSLVAHVAAILDKLDLE